MQDTSVGTTRTPYKKLRLSGSTKTFVASSKFQIWLNYLDMFLCIDFWDFLQETYGYLWYLIQKNVADRLHKDFCGPSKVPNLINYFRQDPMLGISWFLHVTLIECYWVKKQVLSINLCKKVYISVYQRRWIFMRNFTHLSYTVICICTYQDISLYGQLYMLYTAWYFNFLQMRFIQNYIIHYIARVLAAICQYSLTELISADMLRFYFMFFIKCLRQNSDIGHIFATMPCPFICINRCALPFSTRLWLNDDVIDTSSVLAISLVQVF